MTLNHPSALEHAMSASIKKTAALLECPVCCQSFLLQSPAVAERAVCTHCGAHQLLRHAPAGEPLPREAGVDPEVQVEEPREAVVRTLTPALRDRHSLPRR